jgi:hypothetical protein
VLTRRFAFVRLQDKRALVDKYWAKLSSENHVCFESLSVILDDLATAEGQDASLESAML